MTGRTTLQIKRLEQRRCSGAPTSAPHRSLVQAASCDTLLLSHYQDLTRKHLNRFLDKLIAEFTGLHFHIAWWPVGAQEWNLQSTSTGCSVCCKLAKTSLAARPDCRVCGARQLDRVMSGDHEGTLFKCRLGVLNYWLPVRVRDSILGIAYLQALDTRSPGSRASRRGAKYELGLSSRSDFRRAAQLLHLIVSYVQALDLAELRQVELTNADHAMVALEREQVRLHELIRQRLPPAPLISPRSGKTTHGEQSVQQLLDCISREYSQPITLRGCASKMGMNAAYLSDLFSRAIGVPFKTYLTEMRISKARELLGDFNHTVSEVACAVGLAENRFRVMFKKATGLSPKMWRETLRAQLP